MSTTGSHGHSEPATGWFTRNKSTVMRIVGLTVAGACMAVSGSVFAFNAYANAVKKTYNITQSHVENIASISNFGMCMVFPAGMLLEKLAAGWTLAAGAILTAVSFTLLWISTFYRVFYHSNVYILYFFFFLAGFGSTFGYIAPLTVTIRNFIPSKRGRIIGVLDSCFSLGPAGFSLLYGLFFINGHVTDEENQDLAGYFAFNGIIFAIAYGAGIFLVREIPPDNSRPSERSSLIQAADPPETDQSEGTSLSHDHHGENVPDLTGWELFKIWEFQFILWSLILNTSLQLMFITNIPTYLKSFNNEHYNITLTVLSPLLSVVGKLILGFASDLTIHKVPRVAYQLAINAVQTIFLFLCIFYVGDIVLFFFANFVVSIANSAAWCLTPTILSELFGTKYFGRNWGWSFMGLAILGFMLQAMFGFFYDMHLEGDALTCYGTQCFVYSFIVVTVLSLCGVIFNIGSLEWRVHMIKSGWSHLTNSE